MLLLWVAHKKKAILNIFSHLICIVVVVDVV